MRDGRETILLDEGFRNWRVTRGYVQDVAAAIVLAAVDPRATGRTYNLGERDPWTEEEWILAIGAEAGWGGKVRYLPTGQLPEHLVTGIEFRQDLVIDTSRIRPGARLLRTRRRGPTRSPHGRLGIAELLPDPAGVDDEILSELDSRGEAFGSRPAGRNRTFPPHPAAAPIARIHSSSVQGSRSPRL